MPVLTDEALVLKLVKTGESDLVTHLLLKTRGRRTAFAKNARASRKRFAGALQPFTHIQAVMDVRRTQRLDRLQSADVIESFHDIRQDLARICRASYYCELLDVLLVEGETYADLFDEMLFFLNRLTETEPTLKHRIFFELRILDKLGYRPDFSDSGENGNSLSGGTAFFDPVTQVFCTPSEARGHGNMIPISDEARQALLLATSLAPDQLSMIRMNISQVEEAAAVMRAMVLATVGKPLKTLSMLDVELGT